MNDLSRSPSPNRTRSMKRGLFSSLSSLNILKRTSRLRTNSKNFKSQSKTTRSSSKENYLQVQVQQLSQQLAIQQELNQSLEIKLKKARKSETITLEKAQLMKKTLSEENSVLKRELKIHKNTIESLSRLIVDLGEAIGNEKFQFLIIEELTKAKTNTHADLSHLIDSASKKIFQDDYLPISYTVEYFNDSSIHNIEPADSFEQEYAIAKHDFSPERSDDLGFAKGDIIEIIQKNDSGWWIGRMGSTVGSFPYNFVKLC